MLPSREQIAEDVEVVLHGPSAVVLPQPGVPRKMHVHRQTGNSSIAGIGKLLAPDRALLARYHTHAWLTPAAPGCMCDMSPAMCVSDSQRRMYPTGG